MRLLKIIREAVTNCILVLFGIVADGPVIPTAQPGEQAVEEAPETAGENADEEAQEATSPDATNEDPSNNPPCGDPVDTVTGRMYVNAIDFELPGLIPLVWKRSWYSDSKLIGHLGHGMRSCFEMGLDVNKEEHTLSVYLANGRMATFPQLAPGKEYFYYQESLLLRREADHYCLFDPKTRYSYLFFPSENGYMQYKLGEICNAQGHKISIEYNQKGYISKITDSVGRELTVTMNEAGRIMHVAFGDHVLAQYRYSDAQDLTEVIDAIGQSTHMEYRNHLMVKRTDRNKNSFYWEYDKLKIGARVTKTWGDGNVLAAHIEYHDDERYNIVTNSLGVETEYHYDERNICTKIVYADGSEKHREFNEQFELVSEIDEEGRKTSYTYNNWSQLTGITRPDGSEVAFIYDESGRLISITNPEGASKGYVYNDDGTLKSSIDENGAVTTYAYNESRLVEKVTNAKGDAISLAYDADNNLCQVTLLDGACSRWEYDSRGNCLCVTNPLGAAQKYQYDELNRLVRANLADGNEIKLRYNAYDEVIHAKDMQTEISFTYTIVGNLQSLVQSGREKKFAYDTEERLISVTNDKGEKYKFERDIKGNIVKETGFDNATRIYELDLSGLVRKINRPDNRWTEYMHDQLGNVIRAEYYDATWDEYGYNKNGELIEATNEHAALKFKRNAAGQVMKECQDDHWVESKYDDLGNRLQVSSSLGAKIVIARNTMGQVSQIAAVQAKKPEWAARMQYNKLGQEIERMLPGEVISRWQYDITGKPKHHYVQIKQRDTCQCRYEWDINNKLKKMTNMLTSDQTTYGYDEFSNLVWANYGELFGFINRATDEVGNIYETRDKIDRIYDAGSRLKQSGVNTKEGTCFDYDGEGNLVRKIEENGDCWQYEYFGNGMLSKVVKPDGTKVAFQYDSLGRRTEKKMPEKTKKFIWDGNNLLHELVDKDTITWVLNDEFVPTAKLTSSGNYSIVSDYLGTPLEAYDEAGVCVWSVKLDLYGRVRRFTGEVDFIPFRYKGQYDDVETGLYYNRFRYYAPVIGQYTQQDPIRLVSKVYNLYQYVSDPNIIIDPFGLDWNYVLTDISGREFYSGRAADTESMMSVAGRHAGTIGTDGARFGSGDTLTRTTGVGTPYDTVRGVEERGIQSIESSGQALKGRGSPEVRGNKIRGISDAKQKTTTGQQRLSDADNQLGVKDPKGEHLTYDEYTKRKRG